MSLEMNVFCHENESGSSVVKVTNFYSKSPGGTLNRCKDLIQ